MAVPKQKTSRSKRGSRRSHHQIKRTNYTYDSKSGDIRLSHRISLLGYYNNKRIIILQNDKSKK